MTKNGEFVLLESIWKIHSMASSWQGTCTHESYYDSDFPLANHYFKNILGLVYGSI